MALRGEFRLVKTRSVRGHVMRNLFVVSANGLFVSALALNVEPAPRSAKIAAWYTGTRDGRAFAVAVMKVRRGSGTYSRHTTGSVIRVVVALNRFITDSNEELEVVRKGCEAKGARVALCNVWEEGGAGGIELAEEVLDVLKTEKSNFKPLYDEKKPIREKIEIIAQEIYGADGVDFTPMAARKAKQLAEFGLGETPVCIAKTQYSFSDDPSLLGAPEGFRITIRDMYPSAGAGFVVALAGDVMTMPGLGKTPAAERMKINADGAIEGLF